MSDFARADSIKNGVSKDIDYGTVDEENIVSLPLVKYRSPEPKITEEDDILALNHVLKIIRIIVQPTRLDEKQIAKHHKYSEYLKCDKHDDAPSTIQEVERLFKWPVDSFPRPCVKWKTHFYIDAVVGQLCNNSAIVDNCEHNSVQSICSTNAVNTAFKNVEPDASKSEIPNHGFAWSCSITDCFEKFGYDPNAWFFSKGRSDILELEQNVWNGVIEICKENPIENIRFCNKVCGSYFGCSKEKETAKIKEFLISSPHVIVIVENER